MTRSGSKITRTDRALGRSRGGPTTKIHLACDGRDLPLSFLITGGNINDRTRLIQSSKQSASPAARPGGHAFGRCTSSPTRAIPPTRSAPIYLAAGSLTPSPGAGTNSPPAATHYRSVVTIASLTLWLNQDPRSRP
jgi:hypothetical protein